MAPVRSLRVAIALLTALLLTPPQQHQAACKKIPRNQCIRIPEILDFYLRCFPSCSCNLIQLGSSCLAVLACHPHRLHNPFGSKGQAQGAMDAKGQKHSDLWSPAEGKSMALMRIETSTRRNCRRQNFRCRTHSTAGYSQE